jgi:predicted GNAT family acetyltransferase
MATEAERVVSICHTPRPVTARAAECGVWTHPAVRGRGYGAAAAGHDNDRVHPLSTLRLE